MEYTYYPGCSVGSTAVAYQEATTAVANTLGIVLDELNDWNCCGATAYVSIKELTSFAISARNLAMAERLKRDLVTPCSGCYVVLQKAHTYMEEYGDVRSKVNEVLSEVDLNYGGSINVRHLLEVFIDDIGFERLKTFVKKPLTGLKVACYSGCQISRPLGKFDNKEIPEKLEKFVEALGATPVNFPMKASCCSGQVMGTERDVGLRLVMNILECAHQCGAECLVCACPLCQLNLDSFQTPARKKHKKNFELPILYFTQLLGLALDIKPKKLGFGREIVSARKILEKLR